MSSPIIRMTKQNTLKSSVVKVTRTILNFGAPMISLERLKLKSSNFANR